MSFEPSADADEMSTDGLIYILANGAAFNGFLIDEENTKKFSGTNRLISLQTSPNRLLEMAKAR